MQSDSDDEALANMEMPESSPQPKVVSSSESSSVPVIEKIPTKSVHSILVNPKQRGNPLLKAINNIPWEFDDSIVPDYVVGKTACVLFLSIRYHTLKPDYINDRLKQLGKMFELRILLVHVDVKVSKYHNISYNSSITYRTFKGIPQRFETSHKNLFID